MKKQLLAIFVLASSLQGSELSPSKPLQLHQYREDRAEKLAQNFNILSTKIGKRASCSTTSDQRVKAACLAQTQANGNSLLPKNSKLARNLKN